VKPVLIILLVLALASCTKEYIEQPTCYRYLELSDKYDGEMVYLKTDTLWPGGRQSTYACDDELKKIENYKPHAEGCEQGYQVIRYEIIK
jgi:hypothetical protein